MSKHRLFIAIGGLIGLLVFASNATAQLIAYEGFDTAPGGVDGTSGATSFGWSGNWFGTTGTGTIMGGGQNYTDSNGVSLPTVGNSLIVGGAVNNATFRSLSSTISTGTVWISFIGQISNGTNSTITPYGGLSLYDSGVEEIFIGDTFNTPSTWAIQQAVGGPTSNSGVSTTSTSLVVLRIDFLGAGDDNIYMFVNPDLGAGNEPAIGSADATLLGQTFQIDGVRFAAGDSVNGTTDTSMVADELRIGQTFGDVAPAPEPTTLWTFSLSLGLVIAIFQRRRSRHA